MSQPARAAVVGSGAWGTALALVLVQRGLDVVIWCYEDAVATAINARRGNPYLEGAVLPDGIRATVDLAEAVRGADVVVSVSPSQFVRSTMQAAAPYLAENALLVSASKGIELKSLLRLDEVIGEVVPGRAMERFCVLSGPSFASEVAQGMPTAVVVASPSESAAADAQRTFQTPGFRVYTNTDVVGVELAGAMKNVVALAAGVTAGLGFGHNTLAALITRGLAEMTRLGLRMGAEKATFYGLAGAGDLVLTCTGSLSRNRTVGFRLGQGESLGRILEEMKAVAEGVEACVAVRELARRYDVEMPIADEVYAIVHEGRSPAAALQALMRRDPKPEDWS